MLKLAIFVVFSLLGLGAAYNGVGSPCRLQDNTEGSCVLIQNCPEALGRLKARKRANHLRCGFENFDEVVCCSINSLFADYLNDIDGPNDITTTTDSPATESPIKALDIKKLMPPTKSTVTITTPKSNRKSDIACDRYVVEKPMPVSTHIIEGTEAALGEFTHMVSLGFSNNINPDLDFDCGGTLISEWYVLTAAHCVAESSSRNPPSVARIGIVDMNGNFNREDHDYPISEIIIYPTYTRKTYYDDIALLRLNRSVSLSAFAYPACLNTDPEDPEDIMYITGWGVLSLRREGKSRYLMKANVTSVPLAECNATHMINPNMRLPNGLSTAHICANDKNFKMDTCQGDSGGPLQIQFTEFMHKIVGVTSFGNACGGGVPAVYAKVYNYLDWIESIVWP